MSDPQSGAPSSPAPLILIADDDAIARRILSAKLERMGYAVAVATDGEQLVKQAEARPPDVIILDLMMPVQDGFSTLRALRRDARFAGTPVIMLSANTGEEEIQRCLDAGATDYFVKPFNPDALVSRIASLCAR